jgi:hypothetical protein
MARDAVQSHKHKLLSSKILDGAPQRQGKLVAKLKLKRGIQLSPILTMYCQQLNITLYAATSATL